MSSYHGDNAERTAEQLRKNMADLAHWLMVQADGGRIPSMIRDALTILSAEPVTAVALCYAELRVAGEIRVRRLFGGDPRTRQALGRTHNALIQQRAALGKRLTSDHKRRLVRARLGHSAPDYLDARVMQHVGGKSFRDALAVVLRRRCLPAGAIDVPQSKWWESITGLGSDLATAEAELPAEVRRLRRLDDKAFRQVVVADAIGASPADVLAHDAVVERWAAHARHVEAQLRLDRESLQNQLATQPGRNRAKAERLRPTCEAYAHASARALAATLLEQDLRVRAVTAHHQLPTQQLRAECLTEAAEQLAKAEPHLWGLVQRACAAHRARCPRAKDRHPCQDCAKPVTTVVKQWTDGTEPEPEQEQELAVEPTPTIEPAPESETDDQDAPADKASEEPTPAAESSPADDLVCDAALRGLDPDVERTVVVVEARSDSDAGMLGFAWLTQDGELRTGTQRSADADDHAIQAMCLAALDLDDGATPIHIVCREAKVADVVGRILRTGSLRDPADILLAARTRELLLEVARRRHRISAAWDPCPKPHRGAAATRELADLALRAARGLENTAAVRAAADRVSQEFSGGVETELTSPEEEGDHAWWETNGAAGPRKRGELVWHAAVYRMHLDGRWCPLPPGRIGQEHDGRRLRLRVDHRDRVHSQPGPEHDVTLRRRGGEWELHGIRWPEGLRPGVIVTFSWPTGGSHVTARTSLLRAPERVDGTEFLHRYDARVVTREAAPGADQDRDVPDLSDASWVLRTLRKLGYLSPHGSATLAEDALARNCHDLGLPRSRLNRLPAAVEQLVRMGRIERVRGSLDRYGRPSYPARSGHVPTELLRYVPSVETLDHSVRREVENAWRRQRDTHWVTGFVRRLPPGAEASEDQVELHRQAVEAAEVVDQWLPEGYTYVRRHRRGGSG